MLFHSSEQWTFACILMILVATTTAASTLEITNNNNGINNNRKLFEEGFTERYHLMILLKRVG